jgi:hypothetical protein
MSGACDILHHKDSNKIRHLDSARDLQNLRGTAVTAVKQCSMSSSIDIEYGTADIRNSWPSITDGNVQLQKQQQCDETEKEQHSSSSSGGLDIRSVLSTIADPVVFSQCLLAFLEQFVAGALVVLVPAVMGVPTWLVGVIYIAMVSHILCA